MRRLSVGLGRHDVIARRPFALSMVAVPVGAYPVIRALLRMIATSQFVIDKGVGGGRFGRAGRRIHSGCDDKHGDQQGHRRDKSCPSRHRPAHDRGRIPGNATEQYVTWFTWTAREDDRANVRSPRLRQCPRLALTGTAQQG